MARNKVAHRKKTQNKFSIILVSLVVIILTIVVAVKSVELKQKIELVAAQEEAINKAIEEEGLRAEEIEELRKEMQTKGKMEELARTIYGMVYEGEIVFEEED